jgi:putative ABC transport system ATP-binding protein
LLFDLNDGGGTTLVPMTHDMNLARRCQRVLNLQNGVLSEITIDYTQAGVH